ncbi:MAG TPA: hypothetical protein VJ464_05920 [Blastocatellia bacterium]|nr:hypothetical protein [Blastocatellia bacterium]
MKKARRVSLHPNWMRDHLDASKSTGIIPVLVTPVSKITQGVVSHLKGVTLWPLNEFRNWAEVAVSTIRELRTTFLEPGDLIWRAHAAELFVSRGLDATSLTARLKQRLAKDHLKPI